jgi:hypothetical protein
MLYNIILFSYEILKVFIHKRDYDKKKHRTTKYIGKSIDIIIDVVFIYTIYIYIY